MPIWKASLFIIVGIGRFDLRGQFFVDGLLVSPVGWGVSESIIGLTLVAGGTSFLSYDASAALKKNPEMRSEMFIGSNLFNIYSSY